MTGTLYGLGVGPGDPELLTLKAHRILTGAPVVAYPAPDERRELCPLDRRAAFLTTGRSRSPIVVPMRVERFPAAGVYDEAAEEIAAHLDAGRDVAVLCEGDPFFYGSFMYLFERLAGRYPVEIVPGVSSLMACGARRWPAAGGAQRRADGHSRPAAGRGARSAAASRRRGRDHEGRPAFQPDAGAARGRSVCSTWRSYCERVAWREERVMPLARSTRTSAPYFSMILIYKGAEDWIRTLPSRRGSRCDEAGRRSS